MYAQHDTRRPDPFAGLLTIDPAHDEIDRALLNWAAWLRGNGRAAAESPMFRLYRSSHARSPYGQLTQAGLTITSLALNVERVMRELPEKHRAVLVGWYVWRSAPWVLARQLAIRNCELQPMLHDARTMARNRMALSHGARWAAKLQTR